VVSTSFFADKAKKVEIDFRGFKLIN